MTKNLFFHLLPLLGILLVGLACGGLANSGVTEANVRVTGLPQFVCPSSTPRPTHTALPTLTQVATSTQVSIPTPLVYATYPPYCNTSRPATLQYICPPHACLPLNVTTCGWRTIRPQATPNPAGFWYGGGTGYGPTATPRPTHTPYPTRTPYPTPTPYVVSENYAMGNDVYVGGTGGLQLRFRISNPLVVPLSANRQVVVWQVAIGNVGTLPYHALPGAQSFVSHLKVNGQVQTGYWYASAEAGQAVNVPLDAQALDIVVVQPGQTVQFPLTAFTPVGELYKLAWILDPYSGGHGEILGGNTALWVNEPDPHQCVGNVGVGFTIPTPARAPATATPSVTPYLPPYSGYRGGR
jgi:hypothetical protein